MVGQRPQPLGDEELGRLVHRVAREAVDDAGVALVLGLEQVEQLLARLVLRHDPVLDVGPVEARHEMPGALARPQVQPLRDLGVGGLGGSGGQRDPGHVRPALVQLRQREVVGPEVVAPLRDAVRLVDGEQRDLPAAEQRERGRHPQPLRRQVEQVDLAGEERRLGRPALVRGLRGVEEPGADAERAQGVDLVLHQRDQRRDDHTDAVADQRGDLVAQRLAAAGRHQHERVTAAADVLDDLRLVAPEGVVTEDAVQDVGGRARGRGPSPGRSYGGVTTALARTGGAVHRVLPAGVPQPVCKIAHPTILVIRPAPRRAAVVTVPRAHVSGAG